MQQFAVSLLASLTVAVPVTVAADVSSGADHPPAAAIAPAQPGHVEATSNISFVKNIPYPAGTDIEFGEFTVTALDESGSPICERDQSGQCRVDEAGNTVLRTEQRDYAFAGSQHNGIRIVDITDPEESFVTAHISCEVNQADIQIRPDLGLLGVGVDSDTTECGLGGTQGVLLFNVSDPRSPEQVGVFKHDRGAHNLTFHPTEPLMYISDSDVANSGLGEIPIVDLSDPVNPELVNSFAFHAHSPHDITFNSDGTRAYTSSISHSDILDTTDPRNPALISAIHDPAVNIHHQSDPTPDGRYLIIADELAGAAADPQCPGGGLHFYDISNEQAPVKAGVFSAQDTEQRPLCTAHVFRINPEGTSLTIGWYSAGTRVVDISDPTGLGAIEVAHMIPSGLGGNGELAQSWASKMWKDNYIYSNDRNRGLDIMRLQSGTPPAPEGADAVIAVADTGINPYHEVFRWDDPHAFQHPATWLPDYPENAQALPITLDEPNYHKAVRQDCELWKKVEPGTLYWFPGTKIVGAISFANGGTINCENATGMLVLDTNGHGTMTASRAASSTYGGCRECLVVATQFPTSIPFLNPSSSTQPAVDAVRFAADNASWIDSQSNSWGPFVPAWDPTGSTGLLTANPQLVRAVEEVSQAHAAFWASGNGVAFRAGIVGHPTILTPHFTPSAVTVGGMDSGHVNTWPGFPPHVVSDSCDSWAAHHRSTTDSADDIGSGTSAATPFAAGGATRILIEARAVLGDTRTGVRDGVVAEGRPGIVATGPLADGVFTLDEWKDTVFKTATPRPVRQFEDGDVCGTGNAPYNTSPARWASVPRDVPTFAFLGYGAIDDLAQRHAFQILRGKQPMPDRATEDAYFAADQATREALHQIWRTP